MKLQSKLTNVLFLFLGCFFLLFHQTRCSFAQSWDARYANVLDAAQWKWAQVAWDGDDKPFIAIRSQIDRAIAKGQKPEVLLQRYKVAARRDKTSESLRGSDPTAVFKKWRDAKAQFAYAYSAYVASQAVVYQTRRSSVLLLGVPFALEGPSFPRSYQYARLMFLVMTKQPGDQRLRWAGDRLVKRNPKDYLVKRGLARTLIYTSRFKKPEKEQALRLIDDCLRANPKDAVAFATRGALYYVTSEKTRDVSEVQKSINAYETYLKLAPKDSDFRPKAERLIAELKQRKKEFAS